MRGRAHRSQVLLGVWLGYSCVQNSWPPLGVSEICLRARQDYEKRAQSKKWGRPDSSFWAADRVVTEAGVTLPLLFLVP